MKGIFRGYGRSFVSKYDGLCYLLCYILVAVAILILLVLPFVSLSTGKESNEAQTYEEELLYTSDPEAQTAPQEDVSATEQTVFPLSGSITSDYGWRTLSGSGYRFHYGIDISPSGSDSIMAYKRGLISETGYSSSYGNYILISHGDHESFYAHCDKIYATEGSYVQAGEVIGLAGSTGNSTGKHLHFEIRVKGSALDPISYIYPDGD